jgi:hypothetical protein
VKTIIHVNQHRIRANRKNGRTDPVITVKTHDSNIYAHAVAIDGPSRVVYSPDKPLSCGARVWVETEAGVQVTKPCNRCGDTKPLGEFCFGRRPSGKVVYDSMCRDCRKVYKAEYDKNNWHRRQHDPVKRAAQNAVSNAIKAGTLTRPDECERCGKPGGEGRGKVIEAHHADYGKPLDVEWLCRGCHKAEHWKHPYPIPVPIPAAA